MSNTIKLKRGSGSDPSASDLSIGEIAIRTDNGKLFTKKDNGSVAEISGSGGIDDGDKGDITVSNSGDTFTIDNGVITNAKIADGQINSAKIVDGSIVNVDINASAAIAGTKISPDFGSQDITASDLILTGTGTSSSNSLDLTYNATSGVASINADSNGGNTALQFGTSSSGTLNTNRLGIAPDGTVSVAGNLDVGAGVDVTGNITVSGTVDGVDIAARNTLFSGLTSSSGVLTNGVTATTQSAGDNSTKIATTAYTDTAVSNLVDSAPSALNTLNELAAALGDDANFSTTVTNSIATKLPLAGGTLTGNVIHNDNVKAIFGTSSDGLEVFHDGSHSFIKDSGTGALKIVGNDIRIENASNRNVFKAIGTACELYFDTGSATSKKFETTAGGAIVHCTDASDGFIVQGDLRFRKESGTTTYIKWDGSDEQLEVFDDVKVSFGNGHDLQIYHDGSNSRISDNGTGNLILDGNNVIIQSNDNSETIAKFITNGAVELYHNGTKKFETSSAGGTLTGNLTVSGNIGVNGTVAGRDMAADGSKLDGIESGATADQSASEILTLIKTVDGAGSGLDADTLDGIPGTNLVRADTSDTLSGATYTFSSTNAQKIILQGASNPYIRFREGTTDKAYIQWHSDGYLQLANSEDGSRIRIRDDLRFTTDNFSSTNYKIWHEGNDGAGSGLAADVVDGLHASSFVRSDASDTLTGSTYTLSSSTDQKIILSGSNNPYIRFQEGTTNKAYIQWATSGYLQIVNQEDNSLIRIKDDITFSQDGGSNNYKIWHANNDGSGSGLDADTVDGVQGSSFARSDANDTLSGIITLSSSSRDCLNFSANSSDDNRGLAFNGRIAISADYNDGYLRLNNASEFGNGVYTPLVMRADNGFQVDGTTVINGSAQLIASRLTGALPAIDGSNLTGISAGATGGGSDEVFYENGQTVTTNYTITNGKNAMCAGPITINSGVTVTVGSGENLTIV